MAFHRSAKNVSSVSSPPLLPIDLNDTSYNMMCENKSATSYLPFRMKHRHGNIQNHHIHLKSDQIWEHAILLTNVSAIAQHEIEANCNSYKFTCEDDSLACKEEISYGLRLASFAQKYNSHNHSSPFSLPNGKSLSQSLQFQKKKACTVIESGLVTPSASHSVPSISLSKTSTPIYHSPNCYTSLSSSQLLSSLSGPALVSPGDFHCSQQQYSTSACKQKKQLTILKRKFSWKNYPELEAFLIANREEYLQHSALNYTAQQKQYNNCLTERLVKVAASNGYMFDKEAFSFARIRDRIRCYFKSYVQSSKKRGVIIGYAATKSGLLPARG